jgi:EF hand
MKMHTTRFTNISVSNFSKLSLTGALIFCSFTLPAIAADSIEASKLAVNDTSANDSWQDPTAQEFSRLDTSGNGLLMPSEASKGKAFNKKTFAKADTDHDGTIDQDEYVVYKTGKAPAAAKPASVTPANAPSTSAPATEAMPDKAMPKQKDLPMAE